MIATSGGGRSITARRTGAVMVAMMMGLAGLVGAHSAGADPLAAAAGPQLSPTTSSPVVVSSTTTTSQATSTTQSYAGSSSAGPSTTATTDARTGGYAPGTGPPPTPAEAAMAASYRRTPPGSTLPLLAALSGLSALGFTQEQIAIVGFGQFPVAGVATWTDEFMTYRSWPQPHMHQGVDIDAPEGTPIRSPADGTLTYTDADPYGYGLTSIVTQADGTTYLMAHMSATVAGLTTGSAVHLGQVVGFVGQTGDSTGPHVDFEVHPHGGPSVNEKPILDAYVAAAIAAPPALVARYRGEPAPSAPPPVVAVPAPTPPGDGAPLDGRGRTVAALSSPLHSPGDLRPATAVVRLAGLASLAGASALVLGTLRRRRQPPGPGTLRV